MTDRQEIRFGPRVCAGCKKPLRVFAFDGAYWHLRCVAKASADARQKAREAVAHEMRDRGDSSPPPQATVGP